MIFHSSGLLQVFHYLLWLNVLFRYPGYHHLSEPEGKHYLASQRCRYHISSGKIVFSHKLTRFSDTANDEGCSDIKNHENSGGV